jgi:hypothetical protein
MRKAREERCGIEPYALKAADTIPEAQSEEGFISSALIETECSETGHIEDYSDEPDEGFLNSISMQFSEAALFAMSLVFLILLAMDKQMQNDLLRVVTGICGQSKTQRTLGIICIIVPFSLGLALSIFHALSTREKSFFEKALMLFFAVMISAGTGVYMGIYLMLTGGNIWLLIFAACNILYCALLLLKFEWAVISDDLDASHISDRDANMYEIIFTSMTAAMVLYACRYMFELHWVIIYSICITYISAINAGIVNVFKGRR